MACLTECQRYATKTRPKGHVPRRLALYRLYLRMRGVDQMKNKRHCNGEYKRLRFLRWCTV